MASALTDLVPALQTSGRYRTPPEVTRSAGDRLFGRSDAWYYLRLAGIVRTAARKARTGRWDNPTWAHASLCTHALVERCGGRLDISGFEHADPERGPRVVVANHMSLLETFLLPGLLLPFMDIAVVVKESLCRYPVFGHVMRASDPITVSRANPRDDLKTVLTRGKEVIAGGRSVVIFPQHTRSPAFDPALFNSLGAKLAERSRVPLQPIAVKTDFMGVGRWLRDFGRINRQSTVHLAMGPAVAAQRRAREAQAEVVAFIRARLREWGAPIKEPS